MSELESCGRNLVITGYMGAGKSSVGREVARRLGRRFVDMDEEIERRVGMSIADLFKTRGEQAFRLQEHLLCAELAAQEGLVISTGGGALVDAHHRELLGRAGVLVCLDCAPEELARRLQGDVRRPMLWGDDPAARLRSLLQERRAAYAEVPHHIDTTHRSLEQVVQDVLALYGAGPQAWWVGTPTGPYQVHWVAGGLARLAALLRIRDISSRVALVSDDNVWPLYGAAVMAALRAGGYAPFSVVLPAGEEHKNLESVRLIYDRFAEGGLDRSGAVIALGGGVITDMAGFAAATYMRGVPLVQASTTLLGMVDASVGGKVAVDHPRGKNLVGAFVQPLLVMLDPLTLATLPDIERRAGMAEIIKHGVIADAQLFQALEERRGDAEMGGRGDVARPTGCGQASCLAPNAAGVGPIHELALLVQRALAVKIAVVQEDPYERGRRAVLNLGHTFGHAFELLSGYALHHGLAVSMGMAAAARLAEARGLCTAETAARIIAALERHGLPTRHTYDIDEVYRAMSSDKKRRAGGLRFVLPEEIGKVIIADDVSAGEVLAALERSHL